MDHDDEPEDTKAERDLDRHAEWCKDNHIERAMEETVQTGKNTTADEEEWNAAAREVSAAFASVSEIDRLRAELARLRAVAEAARAALLDIARPGVGPELHDPAEERADYWAHACEVERQTAREALAALAALEGT